MKRLHLRESYDTLEAEVIGALKEEIENSKTVSKHVDSKSLKVNVYNYTELVLIDYTLTFIDSNGLHYSVWAECSLEDLIDILQQL